MTAEELKNSQDAMREQRAPQGLNPKTPKTPKKRVYKSRKQSAELKDIRRRIQRLISELEAAPDTASKRLYFEILDQERNRLEGKPFSALPPAKSGTSSNPKLQAALQSLFSGGERPDAPLKPWGARLKQRVRGAQSSPEEAVETDEGREDQATQ
jgi:hypothetical protein